MLILISKPITMKSIKTTLTILLLLFVVSSQAQHSWTGDGDGTTYTDADNWSSTGGGYPMGGEDLIFDIGGDINISMIPGSLTTIGNIEISNSSSVTLQTIPGTSITPTCGILTVDAASSLTIDQTHSSIQLSLSSGVINGGIYLDGNEHKITAPLGSLNFNNVAVFTAGASMLGYPFGESGFENVRFKDGSTYNHYSGSSPFGNSVDNVTAFFPESNYYILGEGSNVLFSNKTYGNIIIGETGEAFINVSVNASGTGTDAFSFNSITTENGSLIFNGSGIDEINILGGFNADNGSIKLYGGVIKFIGNCYVNSNTATPHDIKLISNESTNFTIISENKSLTLESNLTFESSVDLIVDGIIDFKTNKLFLQGTGNINFSNSAKFITANENGIEGSINGEPFSYEPLTTFEFNGSTIQNTGLVNHNLPIGNMIINKPSENLIMDNNIETNSLDLINGNLMIEDNTLYITGNTSIISSENSYIITGRNGFVNRYIALDETVEFPMGTNSHYTPFTISADNSDNFNVQLTENVYQEGNGGNQIMDERLVHLTWNIFHDENSIPYNLNLTWNEANEGAKFNQPASYLSNYDENENKWVKTIAESIDIDDNSDELIATGLNTHGYFSISSIHNVIPVAENQEFTISEDSPTEMLVGKLVATDPDIQHGQILSFTPQEGNTNPDAFVLQEDGQIFVKNSELLEYSLHPVYEYMVNVCDDGNPIQCSEFNVTINLTEGGSGGFSATNYISPNRDGKNDTWIVRGLESGTYKVIILDNKGHVVFRSDNYMNDWNGTNGGNRLTPGVYFYSITTQNSIEKGTITLVR